MREMGEEDMRNGRNPSGKKAIWELEANKEFQQLWLMIQSWPIIYTAASYDGVNYNDSFVNAINNFGKVS